MRILLATALLALSACKSNDVKISPSEWQCSSYMQSHNHAASAECTQYTKRVKAP